MTKRFFSMDCETDPFKYNREPKPFIWGVYCEAEDYYETFDKTEDLAQFVKNQDAMFFAHNGGKFDFMFLAPYFNRNEKCLMINGRLVQVKLGKAELRDSYALLPFPQKQFSDKVEIEDFSIFEKSKRNKPANKKKIRERLKQDCVGLYQAVDAFFEEYGGHLTAPGAAIKTMMKMEKLKIENSGALFFNDMSKYYFGGRCECLQPGEYHEEITYLDINSAYARAMRDCHPIGNKYKTTYFAKPEIKAQNFYEIIATSKGAFCRRDKGTLKFDWDGEPRKYYTTGHELLAARETGKAKIIDHISQTEFEEQKDFKTFIDHFWTQRQITKKGSLPNTFAKLMMCCCYGKFCANPENYDQYIFADPAFAKMMVAGGWAISGEAGGHILVSRPLEDESMRYYNVATGASITGFVRAMLLRAIDNVDRPVYCDTDSIIFTGQHSLPLNSELGSWKIEGTFDEGYFAGKKLYAVKNSKETKIATKGSKLTFKEVKDICRGKEVIYQQDAPQFSWKSKKTRFLERKIVKTA